MNDIFHHHGPMDQFGDGTAGSLDTWGPEAALDGGNGIDDLSGTGAIGGSFVLAPVESPAAPRTAAIVTFAAPEVTSVEPDDSTQTTSIVTSEAVTSPFQIVPVWDTSVLDLDDPSNAAYNPTLYANFTGAVQTAIDSFENEFTNKVSLTIDFGYGEIGNTTPPTPVGSLGESSTEYYTVSYDTIYNALKNHDTTSAVQIAAAGILPSSDPTTGTFQISEAEAAILGIHPAGTSVVASVGISGGSSYDWTQSNFQTGQYDAVAIFEHEISETLGRADDGGVNNDYTPMDLFRYASPGVRDEPFVSDYSATADSYFSYNGTTMELQYDTPTAVSDGEDIADWTNSGTPDAFDGGISPGAAISVSATDWQVMNVLGYDEVTCYLAGTRIETDRGEVAVEALAEGDLLRTVSGELRELRWIGTRVFGGRFAARNPGARPILIRAGALAENTPIRDLYVSPNHAMLLDGVLVPAGKLVNGATIVRAEPMDRIEYFHLELDTHDVIFAEGAASETFVDDGSRAAFHNAADFYARFPEAALAAPALYCAPRVTCGYALAAVRQRLAVRAGLRDGAITAPLRGHVDVVHASGVEGWAWNPDAPNAPVCLDIEIGGVVVARTLANRFRDDLRAAGIGSGRHGFSATFAKNYSTAQLDTLVARRSADRVKIARIAERSWAA